jgi:hypothetical protein
MGMTGDPAPLSFTALADWVDGRLPGERAAEVAHLVAAADAEVQGSVRWLRRYTATAAAVPMHAPPPIVRQQLRRHFADWAAARAVLDRKPRVLSAVLIFDSRRDLALAGVRGGDLDDETIHLAYSTEAGDLVLDLVRTGPGLRRLDGQVLVPADTAARVFEATIEGPGFALRTVDGDETGSFAIEGVPESATRLRASNGEITIVVDLDLG